MPLKHGRTYAVELKNTSGKDITEQTRIMLTSPHVPDITFQVRKSYIVSCFINKSVEPLVLRFQNIAINIGLEMNLHVNVKNHR